MYLESRGKRPSANVCSWWTNPGAISGSYCLLSIQLSKANK